jgi:hypothetical protein
VKSRNNNDTCYSLGKLTLTLMIINYQHITATALIQIHTYLFITLLMKSPVSSGALAAQRNLRNSTIRYCHSPFTLSAYSNQLGNLLPSFGCRARVTLQCCNNNHKLYAFTVTRPLLHGPCYTAPVTRPLLHGPMSSRGLKTFLSLGILMMMSHPYWLRAKVM